LLENTFDGNVFPLTSTLKQNNAFGLTKWRYYFEQVYRIPC